MNVFVQFLTSLYSPQMIIRFRFQGIGKTIAYIFMMMAIISIPSGIMLTNTTIQWTNQVQMLLQEDMPNFQLKGGTLHSEVNEPMIEEVDDRTVLFDASGSLSTDDVRTHKNAIGLLKHEAVIINDGAMEVFPYEIIGQFELSKETAVDLVETVKGLLPIAIPLLLVGGYLFNTALKFIEIFVLSVIGLILKRNAPAKLSYRQIWTLSTYAITLPTTLFALFNVLGIMLPFSFALYWVIAIVMMYLTFKKLPVPKKKNMS